MVVRRRGGLGRLAGGRAELVAGPVAQPPRRLPEGALPDEPGQLQPPAVQLVGVGEVVAAAQLGRQAPEPLRLGQVELAQEVAAQLGEGRVVAFERQARQVVVRQPG
ncbi:hypothetical protein [Actinomadura madurae]|uniref:hypothetical protein n=1 Tax=Actinomadura madurae TaxID=1993 RepID=UPI0020D217A5|nr:hypothetical protein [Actinomadura madurae]MCQ0017984.1 hypothetical protein [Actinomadura madurae]